MRLSVSQQPSAANDEGVLVVSYMTSTRQEPVPVEANEALLLANGDSQQSANKVCWPAQAEMERLLTQAFQAEGVTLRRAHPYIEPLGHGFIHGQRMGMDVFKTVHPDAPIVIAESVWQYSHHLLAGLQSHRGPILTPYLSEKKSLAASPSLR